MTVYYKSSTKALILKALLCRTMSYKQVDELLEAESVQTAKKPIPNNTIRCTLSRLKKQGLVDRTADGWQITKTGEKYWREKLSRSDVSTPTATDTGSATATRSNSSDLMIVLYDIPESRRPERDWLRRELQWLGFEMKQQSVWIGPAPLPQELIQALKRLQLIRFCNFFRVKKEEII